MAQVQNYKGRIPNSHAQPEKETLSKVTHSHDLRYLLYAVQQLRRHGQSALQQINFHCLHNYITSSACLGALRGRTKLIEAEMSELAKKLVVTSVSLKCHLLTG